MYPIMLGLHNLTRWLVVAAAIYALVRAWRGWLGNAAWTGVDERSGKLFARLLGIQFLIGLLLYFVLSPITKAAFSDFGAAMRDPAIRYFAVEHIVGMVIALALAEIGTARARKASTDIAKFKTAAIFYTIAFVVVLASIPWQRPVLPNF